MVSPIALQLYTLRDALAADFESVIRQVADMGYIGVETAGNYGKGVNEAVALFKELGLQVTSAHSPMPLGDNKNKVLDTILALGCKYTVVPWLPPERFTSRADIEAVCEQLNEAGRVARENHLKLLYHNHWFEFTPIDTLNSRTPFELMCELLSDDVAFEFDIYWIKTGGSVPVDIIKKHGSRSPLLHIKDGPAFTKEDSMVAVGDGSLDYSAIIDTVGNMAEWLIVELDRCATDMHEAVRKSYDYLIGKGLARGSKD